MIAVTFIFLDTDTEAYLEPTRTSNDGGFL